MFVCVCSEVKTPLHVPQPLVPGVRGFKSLYSEVNICIEVTMFVCVCNEVKMFVCVCSEVKTPLHVPQPLVPGVRGLGLYIARLTFVCLCLQ